MGRAARCEANRVSSQAPKACDVVCCRCAVRVRGVGNVCIEAFAKVKELAVPKRAYTSIVTRALRGACDKSGTREGLYLVCPAW